MIKLIVNISICALWMLGIVYLILRLRDNRRNFKKYDTVRGYDMPDIHQVEQGILYPQLLVQISYEL